MKYERQVSRLAILTGLPGVTLSLYLLWNGGASPRLLWTVGLLLGGAWRAAIQLGNRGSRTASMG